MQENLGNSILCFPYTLHNIKKETRFWWTVRHFFHNLPLSPSDITLYPIPKKTTQNPTHLLHTVQSPGYIDAALSSSSFPEVDSHNLMTHYQKANYVHFPTSHAYFIKWSKDSNKSYHSKCGRIHDIQQSLIYNNHSIQIANYHGSLYPGMRESPSLT